MGNNFDASQAQEIAREAAKIISQHGFCDREPAVRDVLLFGSALRQATANDIDMLLIHNHSPLNEFGFVTKYEEGGLMPDEEAKMQPGQFLPEHLLEAVGGDDIDSGGSIHELMIDIRRELLHANEEQNGRGLFRGKVDLPHLQPIHFPDAVPWRTAEEAVEDAIETEVVPKLVLSRIGHLMRSMGLDINGVLDLHAMNVGMLDPSQMHDERRIAIAQCPDPTYWHEVLSTGRLYNSESHDFDTPVDTKYPEAIALFQQ